MTEKRFTYEYDEYNGNLFDNKMNTFYHIEDSDENIKIFCDRLNSLVDENEQLKKELDKLKVVNEMLSIDFSNSEHELLRENEQLKETIKEVIELLSDEVDVFSDKATEHDIIAYRELNQLDNKDAYYMATATKKAIKMLKGDVYE